MNILYSNLSRVHISVSWSSYHFLCIRVYVYIHDTEVGSRVHITAFCFIFFLRVSCFNHIHCPSNSSSIHHPLRNSTNFCHFLQSFMDNLCFLRQLKKELTKWADWVGHQASGVYLSLLSQYWDHDHMPRHQLFYVSSGDQIQVLVSTRQALYKQSLGLFITSWWWNVQTLFCEINHERICYHYLMSFPCTTDH